MVNDLVTLGFLILLQVVLGPNNLLYISLESKRGPSSAPSARADGRAA